MINKYKKDEGYLIDREATMSDLPTHKLKRSIWLLFEYPHSSIYARTIAIISVIIIIISIALFCIETLPEVKAKRSSPTGQFSFSSLYYSTTTTTPIAITDQSSADSDTTSTDNSLATTQATALISTTPIIPSVSIKDEFFLIETICTIWFSIELVMRFYAAPDKKAFMKQMGNIIDLFSILPYFMQITDTSAKFSILRIIRLVRVFRIFKLAKHFKGLQILAHTFKASANELMLLMIFIIIGVILFSSTLYFVEMDTVKSDFHSIPDGFWYAIITMTTVSDFIVF